jgi:hypothetical protein
VSEQPTGGGARADAVVEGDLSVHHDEASLARQAPVAGREVVEPLARQHCECVEVVDDPSVESHREDESPKLGALFALNGKDRECALHRVAARTAGWVRKSQFASRDGLMGEMPYPVRNFTRSSQPDPRAP